MKNLKNFKKSVKSEKQLTLKQMQQVNGGNKIGPIEEPKSSPVLDHIWTDLGGWN